MQGCSPKKKKKKKVWKWLAPCDTFWFFILIVFFLLKIQLEQLFFTLSFLFFFFLKGKCAEWFLKYIIRIYSCISPCTDCNKWFLPNWYHLPIGLTCGNMVIGSWGSNTSMGVVHEINGSVMPVTWSTYEGCWERWYRTKFLAFPSWFRHNKPD